MGIRVKKMIGWGLTDVQHVDYQIQDPRINPDSPLLHYDARLEDYLAYLRTLEHPDLHVKLEIGALTREKEPRPDAPQRAFIWDAEYGEANVLCMHPVWMPDWYRSDDTIDWVEETYVKSPQGENGLNRVEVLAHPIYPFSGIYMDARTGKRLSHEVMTFIRVRYDDGFRKLQQHDLDGFALAVTGMNWADACQFIVPIVPEEIRSLAGCFRLFRTEDAWLQLRPMIYTWWS